MKTDRNAPCPCGSGLKYKKCHGNPLSPQTAAPPAPALTRAQLVPDQLFAQALHHHQGGEFTAAAALYGELLQAHPRNPDVLHNLGLVLLQQGLHEEALARIGSAIEVEPTRAAFRVSRATLLVVCGRYAEAVDAFAPLARLLDGRALQNYAVALGRLGRSHEALALCRRTLESQPGDVDALGLQGNLLTDLGQFEAAQASYGEALRLRVDSAFIHSNMLLMLNYSDGISTEALLEQHLAFGAQHGSIWESLPPVFPNERSSARRLRLGFVSPDLGEHPVGYLFEPLLEHLDLARYEPFFYATRQRDDGLTARLRARAAAWRECHAMTDTELVQQIRADRIDLLIDLAGHTAGNRLAALARRAAPVQLSYLGYPTTTGLASFDFRLSDAWIDPAGTDAGSETVLHLEGGMFRYAPPQAPEPAPSPLLASGVPTFGCFCNLSKLSDQTVALWARVLQAQPRARLLVKAVTLADAEVSASLLAAFERHGIASERIELTGGTPYLQHLNDYARIDVMLDTLPFNLAANTCEALWMGVPVVSLSGDRAAGRMGASLLNSAGLGELLAGDADEFVRIATGLVADPAALAQRRQAQRERLRCSTLFDGASLARAFEAAMQKAFAHWLERAGPAPVRESAVLHVGCGSPEAGKLPAYFAPGLWRELRLDIDLAVKPDFVASMTDMSVVTSGTMQALYSSHNVEHLYVGEVPKALAEFLRVLEPGGFALITVPDLRAAAERVLSDEHELPMYHSPAGPINALDMIYGYAPFIEGGNHFMVHKTGFTCKTLTRALTQAGFERVITKSSGFALWAVAYKPKA